MTVLITKLLLTVNSIPRLMSTMQFDIEDPSWDSLTRDCNLVHMRLLYGSIQTDMWPGIYQRVFEYGDSPNSCRAKY